MRTIVGNENLKRRFYKVDEIIDCLRSLLRRHPELVSGT